MPPLIIIRYAPTLPVANTCWRLLGYADIDTRDMSVIIITIIRWLLVVDIGATLLRYLRRHHACHAIDY